jgi:3-methyladenine DNA glycosylase Mpg
MRLDFSFFNRAAPIVARDLRGRKLSMALVAGMILETEVWVETGVVDDGAVVNGSYVSRGS